MKPLLCYNALPRKIMLPMITDDPKLRVFASNLFTYNGSTPLIINRLVFLDLLMQNIP